MSFAIAGPASCTYEDLRPLLYEPVSIVKSPASPHSSTSLTITPSYHRDQYYDENHRLSYLTPSSLSWRWEVPARGRASRGTQLHHRSSSPSRASYNNNNDDYYGNDREYYVADGDYRLQQPADSYVSSSSTSSYPQHQQRRHHRVPITSGSGQYSDYHHKSRRSYDHRKSPSVTSSRGLRRIEDVEGSEELRLHKSSSSFHKGKTVQQSSDNSDVYYNTSQSATPTRDEHSDTIGEVIIKKLNKKKRCDVTDRISSSSPPAGELKHRSSTKRKLSEGAVGSMTSNKTAKSSIDISTVKVEGGSDVKRGKFNKTEKLNQESRKKLTKKRKLDTALQITGLLVN